jgi:hypothetical protein
VITTDKKHVDTQEYVVTAKAILFYAGIFALEENSSVCILTANVNEETWK